MSSRVFQRWLTQNYKRCERFVSVNREFAQFHTSSPANSLPGHRFLKRQIRVNLARIKRVIFKVFENFVLSELIFTYDKQNY